MDNPLRELFDTDWLIILPATDELDRRINRAFWYSDELRDEASKLFGKMPRRTTIGEVIGNLTKAKFSWERSLVLLGCCITDLALSMFQPDSPEFFAIAEKRISALVRGLNGKPLAVWQCEDPLVRYGPLSISYLLDDFGSYDSSTQVQRAEVLNKISPFADERQSAELLRICRSTNPDNYDNTKYDLLMSELMSSALRAWRAKLDVEDMERALAFLDRTSIDLSDTFSLCSRFAEAANPDPEIYLTRLLDVIHKKNLTETNTKLFGEVALGIGGACLKTLKDPGGLKKTFSFFLGGNLTLALAFPEPFFVYSLVGRRQTNVISLPKRWLPDVQRLSQQAHGFSAIESPSQSQCEK